MYQIVKLITLLGGLLLSILCRETNQIIQLILWKGTCTNENFFDTTKILTKNLPLLSLICYLIYLYTI